jgi:hypothetical protein
VARTSSNNYITELADEIRCKLREKPIDNVVFSVLDNNIYMAMMKEGSTTKHSLFNTLRSLFNACCGKKFALATPLPR